MAKIKECFPDSIETKVYWLVKKNIPLFGKYIPRPVDYALGRLVGWALYIIAVINQAIIVSTPETKSLLPSLCKREEFPSLKKRG